MSIKLVSELIELVLQVFNFENMTNLTNVFYIIYRGASFFKNYSTWCFYLDKWISLFYKRKGKLITIPTGQLHYWGEMVPYDMFYPARECLFEGLKAYVFNKVDEFLKVRYGKDYMVVPPEEKREVHPVVAFSCGITSK